MQSIKDLWFELATCIFIVLSTSGCFAVGASAPVAATTTIQQPTSLIHVEQNGVLSGQINSERVLEYYYFSNGDRCYKFTGYVVSLSCVNGPVNNIWPR